nr:immunoglobulin heavy chain junction region [Mus musculus]
CARDGYHWYFDVW